jgi:hypothetical protein
LRRHVVAVRRAFRQQAGQQCLYLGAEGRRFAVAMASTGSPPPFISGGLAGSADTRSVSENSITLCGMPKRTGQPKVSSYTWALAGAGSCIPHHRGDVVAARGAAAAQQHAPDEVVALLRHRALGAGQQQADAGVAVAVRSSFAPSATPA